MYVLCIRMPFSDVHMPIPFLSYLPNYASHPSVTQPGRKYRGIRAIWTTTIRTDLGLSFGKEVSNMYLVVNLWTEDSRLVL